LGEQIWNLKDLALKHEVEDLAKASGFPHVTPENYKYIAQDFKWEGWMLVGEFADNPKDNIPAKVEFIKVSID